MGIGDGGRMAQAAGGAQGIILIPDAGNDSRAETACDRVYKTGRQAKSARPRKEQNEQAEQDQMAEPDTWQSGSEQ